jgi:4-hydroxy-tetrahydrodipicolinate reductase
MAKKGIRVVQFGVGPVGAGIVRLAAGKPGIRIVGAVDLLNVGKDLGDVAGLGRKLGVLINSDAKAVLKKARPDAVMLATGSVLKNIFPQLEVIIEAGVNVVSTCEEMSYPYLEQPALAARIDRLAKKNGVTVLSTGVNPGFLMDAWPLFMTGVCQDVKRIKAVRIQDATPRRLPFQKKIGVGLSLKVFDQLVESGAIRHVGLAQSIGMISAGLGWELDKITEVIEPVVARKAVKNKYVSVKAGQAAGVRQVGTGIANGREVIIMEFEAYVGAAKSYDAVYIEGTPPLEAVIKGGVHGDLATTAMVVNSLPRIIQAPPGLITMKDMPPFYAIPE